MKSHASGSEQSGERCCGARAQVCILRAQVDPRWRVHLSGSSPLCFAHCVRELPCVFSMRQNSTGHSSTICTEMSTFLQVDVKLKTHPSCKSLSAEATKQHPATRHARRTMLQSPNRRCCFANPSVCNLTRKWPTRTKDITKRAVLWQRFFKNIAHH